MSSCLIGKIVNTHGIKGEIKVYPYTDDIENLTNLKKIYMDENLSDERIILNSRVHKNMLIMKLKNLDDMNSALKLKEKYIYISRSDLKELEDGEYYIEDLIGCVIIDNDTNNVIGTLEFVFSTGANDVYEIKREDNSKVYLPAIEEVILNVDIQNKKILVHLMKGLI